MKQAAPKPLAWPPGGTSATDSSVPSPVAMHHHVSGVPNHDPLAFCGLHYLLQPDFPTLEYLAGEGHLDLRLDHPLEMPDARFLAEPMFDYQLQGIRREDQVHAFAGQ